jgi:2,5-furandicarboxylate decarboxylase 1
MQKLAVKSAASLMGEDRFALRRHVARLESLGEVTRIAEPLGLAELAPHLHGAAKAVLFTAAGLEKAHVIGNVVASRARLAAAFEVAEPELLSELMRRLAGTAEIVEIPAEAAPVRQIVWQGADADLTRLPVPFQHGLDGAPYISAAIDYSRDGETGLTNVGIRRLMLRGRQEAGVDLNAPSDLQALYRRQAARGLPMPVAFAVGAHPLDYVAAMQRLPEDELGIVAKLRASPLPVVRCLTSDLLVPADAEIVIEGHLDARGFVEKEGPYGEFLGYYGVVKDNPVFHVDAITMRRDALFQTMTIGGRHLGRTDTSQLNAIRSEAVVWQALRSAVREPLAVYTSPESGGMFNVRIKLRQRVPGEARNAIAAAMGCLANVKHVFVVDEDIDIFSWEQMDWALATRFQADRDLVVQSGFRALPLDPSLGGARQGAKAGFDLTLPFDRKDSLHFTLPEPPVFGPSRTRSVREALGAGPLHFGEIMSAVGSRDGREIVLELDALRQEGKLTRNEDGRYVMG